ncbi:hypothetical protein FQN55_003600 [Onygenales sp. PD_40]|nr:hypothetical protein FQN55_003600 [Onygenales sp. PD_40]KAK2783798.1 hypothetical protein FQN53_008963 [Emmonsiellopsis sp. PD_33]
MSGQFDHVRLRNFTLPYPISLGPDAWAREDKPQPATFSIRVSYPRSLITESGNADNVSATLDYGKLYRKIDADVRAYRSSCGGGELKSMDLKPVGKVIAVAGLSLAAATVEQIRAGAGSAGAATTSTSMEGAEAEVSIYLPGAILRADGGLTYRVVWRRISDGFEAVEETCRVEGIRCNCIIGVNPHERENKQAVVVGLAFRNEEYKPLAGGYVTVPLQNVTRQVANGVEESSFKTVEAMAQQIAETGLRLSGYDMVTVTVEKPSAMHFVEYSGVEITRTKNSFKK